MLATKASSDEGMYWIVDIMAKVDETRQSRRELVLNGVKWNDKEVKLLSVGLRFE